VVDLSRDLRNCISKRVVGELGEVDDGIHPLHVSGRDRAKVFAERLRASGQILWVTVQPTISIEAGIEPDHLMTGAHQNRPQE
jgi:hypothetical protein